MLDRDRDSESESGGLAQAGLSMARGSSGNSHPFASFTHLSYARDMTCQTWISYLEIVMKYFRMSYVWDIQITNIL